MVRVVLAVFLMLVFSIPTYAKSTDVYPVSCDVLWGVVKGTLSNASNYSIVGISDTGQNAAFLVVGELTPHTDGVALAPKEGGCQMKTKFIEIGPDNGNERGFRKRVTKSLAKIKSAEPTVMPAAPVTAPGQE